MLQGIDDIPWAQLSHAYGRAGDVPDILRRLTSDAPADHARALIDMSGCLFHQGSVYSATTAAFPFLVDIAVDGALKPKHRATLVHNLAIGAAASGRQASADWQRELAAAVTTATPRLLSLLPTGGREMTAALALFAAYAAELARPFVGALSGDAADELLALYLELVVASIECRGDEELAERIARLIEAVPGAEELLDDDDDDVSGKAFVALEAASQAIITGAT